MTIYVVQRYEALCNDTGTIYDLTLIDSIHLTEESAQARKQELRTKYEWHEVVPRELTVDTPIFIN